MATTYKTIEVWVLVDENGEYECGADTETAAERYRDNVGEPDGTVTYRAVKLTVKVPLPTTIELSGEVTVEELPALLSAA